MFWLRRSNTQARDIIRSDYRALRSAAEIPEMSLQHKAFGAPHWAHEVRATFQI
jgi:hypothetical protein